MYEKSNKEVGAYSREFESTKNQRNNFGNYNYRSCEDILEAVKPLLAKEELLLTISDSIAPEPLFVNAVAEITDGVDKIQVRAQAGINLNRKGMDVAQCYGASSSYARKYALNGLFLIDDTKDADATNNHSKAPENASTSVLQPNKDWLQEPKDYIGKGKHTEENNPFISCKQAIKEKGFTIADIRKKYKVSKKVEKLLLT